VGSQLHRGMFFRVVVVYVFDSWPLACFAYLFDALWCSLGPLWLCLWSPRGHGVSRSDELCVAQCLEADDQARRPHTHTPEPHTKSELNVVYYKDMWQCTAKLCSILLYMQLDR
jgi:hypothetical protein